MMKPRYLTLAGMIAMAAVARILPHPWNMTPVAAMALFAGAQFRDKALAFGVPLLAMVLSDALLGFHSLMAPVYLCFALTVLLGYWVRQSYSVKRLVAGSLMASVLFFVVTNFGVWLSSGMYSHTLSGLEACFLAALPFFRSTVFGDLAFTAVFFGTFALAEQSFPVLRESPIRA